MEEDKKISLQQVVNMAVWTHNTNINRLGFDPLTLVTGKAVVFPGISDGDIAQGFQQVRKSGKKPDILPFSKIVIY